MRGKSAYHLTCECGQAIVTHEPITVCGKCARLIQIEWHLCANCGERASERSDYCYRCQFKRKQERWAARRIA
jgi:predicted amidophosphoribosyltransferase